MRERGAPVLACQGEVVRDARFVRAPPELGEIVGDAVAGVEDGLEKNGAGRLGAELERVSPGKDAASLAGTRLPGPSDGTGPGEQ